MKLKKTQKKSEGMPLNTIIIAALVLVVLIVLIAIFSGRMNIFGKSYTETGDKAKAKVCWGQGGHCVDKSQGAVGCNSGENYEGTTDFVDCGKEQTCCIPRK